MTQYDYDLFVIGAGSGGVRASRIAASYGANVAIAEEYRVGGTCVIRGCVPKKLLVYASHFPEYFEDAEGYGWSKPESTFEWSKLIANKDAEIDRLNSIYIKNIKSSGVEIFQSRAELVDKHTIKLVGLDKTVTAERILIATGGTPHVDDEMPGVEHTITSNEAFHLEEFPKRVIVTGGGYIAVEFACIFNGLGAETHLMYRGDQILRGFDNEVRQFLFDEMTKKGIKIHLNDVFTKVDKAADGLHVHTKQGKEITVDEVMFAIGRKPAIQGLGLENAGVKLNKKGAIEVDELSQTNVENIYAVGDVTDRVNLTPVAIREGHAFADTVYGGKEVIVDHSCIATAVFSQPEIGTVGLGEEEAVELYGDIDVYRSSFRPMKNILPGRDEKMLLKILVDAKTDRVVGCHIIGPESGEMSQLVGVAMKMGATKADFDQTVAVHPTASEELVTMRTVSEKIRK
ncbi:MAG: glutathione-disulfide reductase [Hyphomicrobiales bacterium]